MALNFGSLDMPNISNWMELGSLVGAKVVNSESEETISQDQVNKEDGLRNRACLQVVLKQQSHFSPIITLKKEEPARKYHSELLIKSKSHYTLTLSKLNPTFSAKNFTEPEE